VALRANVPTLREVVRQAASPALAARDAYWKIVEKPGPILEGAR
jgi:hypothetical protein